MTNGPQEQLRLNHQVDHDLASGLFNSKVLERGDTEVRSDGWATAAREVPPLGEPFHRYRGEGRESLLVEVDGVLLQLNLFSGNVYLKALRARSSRSMRCSRSSASCCRRRTRALRTK